MKTPGIDRSCIDPIDSKVFEAFEQETVGTILRLIQSRNVVRENAHDFNSARRKVQGFAQSRQEVGLDNFRIAERGRNGLSDIGADQTRKVILFSHTDSSCSVGDRVDFLNELARNKDEIGMQPKWETESERESFSRGIRSRADLRISWELRRPFKEADTN